MYTARSSWLVKIPAKQLFHDGARFKNRYWMKRKSCINEAPQIKEVKEDDDKIINNGVVLLAIFYAAFRGTLKKYMDKWNRKGNPVSDAQKVKLAKALSKITPADVDLHNAVFYAIFKKNGQLRKKSLKSKPGNCLKEQDLTFKILQQYCISEIPFRTEHGNIRKGMVERITHAAFYARVVCGNPDRLTMFPLGGEMYPRSPVSGEDQLYSMYGSKPLQSCTTPFTNGYHPDKYAAIDTAHSISLGIYQGNIASPKPLGEISETYPLTPGRIEDYYHCTPFSALVITTDVAVLTSERYVNVTAADVIKRGGGVHLGEYVRIDFEYVVKRLNDSPAFLRHIECRSFPLHKLGHLICEMRQWIKYTDEDMLRAVQILGAIDRKGVEASPAVISQRAVRRDMYQKIVTYFLE